MREKIYNILNKIYGGMLMASFFAGILPLFPFLFAIVVGGSMGENIAIFLYKQVYPWIIAGATISIVIGLIAMYIGKKQGLSVKKVNESK